MFSSPYSPSNDIIAELCPNSLNYPQLHSSMFEVALGTRRSVPTLENLTAAAVMKASLNNSIVKSKIGEIVKSHRPEAFTPLFFGNCRALRELILQNIDVDAQTCVIVHRDALFVVFKLEREHCLVKKYPEGTFPLELLEIFELLLNCKQTTVTVCLNARFVHREMVSRRIDRMSTLLGLAATHLVPSESTRQFVNSLSPERQFFTRSFIRPQG